MAPVVQSRAPFPIDALAPWQQEMVEGVAARAQADSSIAAMFCLGFSAFALGRSVAVVDGSGRPDPVNLWMMVIAGSGAGKSESFWPLIRPLLDVQRVAAHPTGTVPPEPRASDDGPGVPGPSLYDLVLADDAFDFGDTGAPHAPRRTVASVPWATCELAAALVRDAQAREFAQAAVGYHHADITPEALALAASTQTMGVLQASPEAELLSHVSSGGRRAVGQLAQLNNMFDGRSVVVTRISRPPAAVERALLTIVAGPQPVAFEELLGGRVGRLVTENGFLARCLLCRPPSNVGIRLPVSPPLPREVEERYASHIRALMILGLEGRDGGARRLPLSAEAEALRQDFYAEIEARLGPGGDLHDVHPWVSRLRQSTTRISAILQLADRTAERRGAFADGVSAEAMRRAIRIGRWCLEEGRQVLGGSPSTRPESPARADVPEAIVRLIDGAGSWIGTAAELFSRLGELVPEAERAERWPQASNALTRRLRDLTPTLARDGIMIRIRRRETGSEVSITREPGQ